MFVTISTEGVIARHEGIPSLDDLYEHIKCQTVEAIGIERDGEEAVVWMDEEYSYREEQALNPKADLLVRRHSPGTLIGGVGIGGNVVVTGPADHEGETTGLSEEWATYLEALDMPTRV